MKFCTNCGKEKSFDLFYRDYRRKDSYRPQCKECMNYYSRSNENKYKNTREKYRVENQDKIRIEQRRKYIRNREKILRKNAEYRNSCKYKFMSYRASATRRGILFDITYDQFKGLITNSYCYYCNEFSKQHGVDRKDSSEGYVLFNIVPCCSMCNRMKNIYSEVNFLNQIKKIYENKYN